MKMKTYSLNGIEYGFVPAFRKWQFKLPQGNSFLTPVKEGSEGAVKVANILKGSLKRSGGVDNLARANIQRLAWN